MWMFWLKYATITNISLLSGSKNVHLFPTGVYSYYQFWKSRMLTVSPIVPLWRCGDKNRLHLQIRGKHRFKMQSSNISIHTALSMIILAQCRATSLLKWLCDPWSWPFGCHPSRWPRGSGLHARRGTAGWEERPEAGSRMHPCRHRTRAPSTLFYLREAQTNSSFL